MDRRIKHTDHEADRVLRQEMYANLASGKMTIGEAVKRMQKISKLTQPEFARHRGISVEALRKIQADTGNPTVETLNKIASIFGLKVGFVPIFRDGQN